MSGSRRKKEVTFQYKGERDKYSGNGEQVNIENRLTAYNSNLVSKFIIGLRVNDRAETDTSILDLGLVL